MRIVPFSDAESGLKTVLDQVIADADYTVIARADRAEGSDDAVVMSLETFNSLMETVHLLSSPANAAHLAQSIAEYRDGKVSAHIPPRAGHPCGARPASGGRKRISPPRMAL
jgi:antitoxin YefM